LRFPMHRAARPLESSRPRAHHEPRRTGSVRAADRRSVDGAPPYVRRSRPGTTAASPRSRCRHPGRAAPLNVARSPLVTPTLPPHRAICAAAVELRRLCFPRPSNRPCPFPRPYRTFTCHLLSRLGSCRCWSWAAAATAVGPRRAPTPARPLSQLRPPPDPRWASGRAPPLPRPGARLARRNSAGAAASPCLGYLLQRAESFQGVFRKLGTWLWGFSSL
jgi:hypothetical protein